MSIFSRAARLAFAHRATMRNSAVGKLTREQVTLGFELMLGRPPIREGELAEALRLRDLRELVGYLAGREEFRSRYPSRYQRSRATPARRKRSRGRRRYFSATGCSAGRIAASRSTWCPRTSI
jgi:hypothetical protein